jgi:hypothetical protein
VKYTIDIKRLLKKLWPHIKFEVYRQVHTRDITVCWDTARPTLAEMRGLVGGNVRLCHDYV